MSELIDLFDIQKKLFTDAHNFLYVIVEKFFVEC